MRYFFDNNLSPRLSAALDALEGEDGAAVRHLRDRFERTTSDVDWMRALGTEGDWVVITSDIRITKNKHEVLAWKESGLTVFFLKNAWLKMTFWPQAAQIVKTWPNIKKLAQRYPTAHRFLVPVSGNKIGEL